MTPAFILATMMVVQPAPDRARSDVLGLSAATYAVGSWSTFLWYMGASGALGDCAKRGGCVTRTDPAGPQFAYLGVMLLLPALPRVVVGDAKGILGFSAVNVAALVAGKWIDGFGPPGVGAVSGFLLSTTIGIVELATTPHRQDLRPMTVVSPIVLHHGGGLAVSGTW